MKADSDMAGAVARYLAWLTEADRRRLATKTVSIWGSGEFTPLVATHRGWLRPLNRFWPTKRELSLWDRL